jgi:DNA modification methylase
MKIDTTYNVNCFDFFSTMEDKSVDYVFTSPPYNRKRNDKYALYDDTLSDYYGFLLNAIESSRRVARKAVIINLQINYYNSADVYKIMGTYNPLIRNMFIWEKTNPLPANGFNITNAYEIFLVIADKPLKSNRTYTKNVIHTSVYSKMPKNHRAVMHPDVARFFIENFTKQNELIFDPFMGIGTTAKICKKLNRHYIGCELVKEYCDVANEQDHPTEKGGSHE